MTNILTTPELATEAPVDAVGPQQRAVLDIIDVARMRAEGHRLANLLHPEWVTAADPAGRIDDEAFRLQLEATTDPTERFYLLHGNIRASSVDLGFIENNGHWRRDHIDEIEAQIRALAQEAHWGLGTSGYLEADSPNSRRRVWIDPGLVRERGKVALRTKRNLFTTRPRRAQLVDMRRRKDPEFERWQQFSIDKVAEFSLDAEVLLDLIPPVEQAIYDEIAEVIASKASRELVNPRSIALVDEAIEVQLSDLISPAVTWYYAHNDLIKPSKMAERGVLANRAIAGTQR